MKIPAVTGLIRRRILLNYAVDPTVVQRLLPEGFRPKLVRGHAVAGICLIRLEEIRPRGFPRFMGVSSENSAHRIAVEWELEGSRGEGVYIPRRDTNSRFNALTGGRIFPGLHHLSKFQVEDRDGRIALRVDAGEAGDPLVDLEGAEADALPETSVFESLDEASGFFEAGCVGYSPGSDSCRLEGLLLEAFDWKVTPLAIDRARSAFFDDRSIFPQDSIRLDHALLMRDIRHEWHSEPTLSAEIPTMVES